MSCYKNFSKEYDEECYGERIQPVNDQGFHLLFSVILVCQREYSEYD
jgi:hypothetical protein